MTQKGSLTFLVSRLTRQSCHDMFHGARTCFPTTGAWVKMSEKLSEKVFVINGLDLYSLRNECC